MTAETTYVLLLSEHMSPSATARAIANIPAVFVHRWMMALMKLFENTERIRKRADEEELKSVAVDMGVTQTHMRFVAVLVALAACERAPVTVVQSAYHSVWTRDSKETQTTYIDVARTLAPACLAVPREVAKDMLPNRLLNFISWKDELRESACDERSIRICRNEDEYYRVWAYVPRPSTAPLPAAAPSPAENAAPAKDAFAKKVVAGKDASATKAVAAKAAEPREIKQLDLPVGGEKFAFDWGAVKSDLHRARTRNVEATDTALLQKLWLLYAGCEASMTLMRQSDRDPLSAHDFAFAADRMIEELEESLAEFYGTYAIEK